MALLTKADTHSSASLSVMSDEAKAWPGRVGYDPLYGARPLKRAIQRYLKDPLADLLLRGEVPDGTTVRVDEGDRGLELK